MVKDLFAQDYNMERIILTIGAITGITISPSKTPVATLLLPSKEDTGKGDFTENFVCSQLQTLRDISTYYYSKENSQLELDFVIQLGSDIIPIEVKAEENLQSKSLKTDSTESLTYVIFLLFILDFCTIHFTNM